jgi:hypothetical protein
VFSLSHCAIRVIWWKAGDEFICCHAMPCLAFYTKRMEWWSGMQMTNSPIATLNIFYLEIVIFVKWFTYWHVHGFMLKTSNSGIYRYSSDKLFCDHAHCLSGFGYTLDNFCHLCFATMLLSLVALSFHCPSPPINICLPTPIYLHTSLYIAQCRSRLVYMCIKPKITIGAYYFTILVFSFFLVTKTHDGIQNLYLLLACGFLFHSHR